MKNNLQYGGLKSLAHLSLRKHLQIDKTQANGKKQYNNRCTAQKHWATSVSSGQQNSDAYSFGTVVLAQSIPEGE